MKKPAFAGNAFPRIEFVPRPSIRRVKIAPIRGTIPKITTTVSDPAIRANLRSVSPTFISVVSSSVGNSNRTSEIRSQKRSFNPQNIVRSFMSWFSTLPLKQKMLFVLMVASITLSVLTVTIIPPVYVFVIRQIPSVSSFTNITVSSCSSSTCIGKETPYLSSIATAFFPFDGNANDQSGYYSGTLYGTSPPSFSTASYLGQTLSLTATQLQYVQIPNVNLAKQSFTIQAWINPGSIDLTDDCGIFSQCDASSVCMALSVRGLRLVLSFDSMNSTNKTLTGSKVISTSSWTHVTVVYDATLYQQQIYLDGQIDAVSQGIVYPYQGASTNITTTTVIGKASSFAYGTTYFQGKIDQLIISVGTIRSACEISNDASLVVYYPFDTNGTFNDYNVNLCNGVGSGVVTISTGHLNQALSFTSSSSYFETQCFPKMRADYSSYSVSLWVNPRSTASGGTLIHLSSSYYGNSTCYDLLAFTNSGILVAQYMTSSTTVNSTQGPVIPTNTWTHISVVYGYSYGVRLFVNGQLSSSSLNTGSVSLKDTTNPMYIILGNISPSGSPSPVNCLSGPISIASGSYSGAIDEFRLYNRELSAQEVCVLAN